MSGGKLSDYLRGLDHGALTRLLELRPDARAAPAPADLVELAARLSQPASVAQAVGELNLDAVVVAEALQLLAPRPSREGLAELLNPDLELLDAALDRLMECGLVWPGPAGGLGMAAALSGFWPTPLGFGRPAAVLLAQLGLADLELLAQGLGIALLGTTKAELVAELTSGLSDPIVVGAVVADLPEQPQALLDRLLTEVPRVQLPRIMPLNRPDPADPVHILLRCGLLLPISTSVAEVPREVGLALRDLAAEFPLTGPPPMHSWPVAPAEVARSGGAAAANTVRLATGLLDSAATAAVPELRDGGIGVREQRRLAKLLDCAVTDVVLAVDLTYSARLLGRHGGMVPTEDYDRWRETEPAERWVDLVLAWLDLDHTPTHRLLPDQKLLAPPLPMPLRSGTTELRRVLLATLAELGPATATDLTSLLARTCWRRPNCGYQRPELVGARIETILDEAGRLGLLADGALTPAGRLLLAGDRAALLGAAEQLLPTATHTVTLQSDLTALVAGEPSRRVVAVLDKAADLEARGAARTWRFSPSSVRRALDQGSTADELLAELTELAPHGVPQPLEYLIRDLARRHGSIRVVSAGCCIYGDDAAQITEILHTRALEELGLRQVAPNVLVGVQSLTETLDRLRKAGFTPVGEQVSGAAVDEARPQVRAKQRGWSWGQRRDRDKLPGVEAPALAARLMAVAASAPAPDHGNALAALAEWAIRLDPLPRKLLAAAIKHGTRVQIDYTAPDGRQRTRVVEELQLDGAHLLGWCRADQDELRFLLEQIESVELA